MTKVHLDFDPTKVLIRNALTLPDLMDCLGCCCTLARVRFPKPNLHLQDVKQMFKMQIYADALICRINGFGSKDKISIVQKVPQPKDLALLVERYVQS